MGGLTLTYPRRIAAITLAGLVGRVLFLGRQPLWRDEAFTALAVLRPIGGMLDAVRHDSAPPLSYLVDHLVAQVSTSPVALRTLPALAGAAAIPLGAALGRRIGGDRAGTWSAAVCALSPALVLSSRDARMYALATTLVMASTLLLWRAVERPSRSRWALYAGCLALALYTQYFAVFAVAAQLGAVILFLRPPRRTVVAAAASALGAGLTLIPWLLVARAQFTHGATPFWVEPVGAKTLSGVVMQFFSGPPIDPGIPGKTALQVLQSLSVGAGVMAVYALWRERNQLTPAARRGVLFVTGCGAGAFGIFVLVSLWHPLVEARYVSVVWGPLLPLCGVGLSLIRGGDVGARWQRLALSAAAMACLGATSAAIALTVVHPDMPAIASDLRGQVGEHDIVSSDPGPYLLVLYYGDPATIAHSHVLSDDVPWFWGTAAYPRGAVIPEVPEDVTSNRGTIFHVVDDSSSYERPPPPGYRLERRLCHLGVCLERIVPEPATPR